MSNGPHAMAVKKEISKERLMGLVTVSSKLFLAQPKNSRLEIENSIGK